MRLSVAIVVALTLTLLGSACNIPNPEDYKNTDKPTEPPPPPPPNDNVKGFAITSVEPSTGSLKGQELVEIHGGGFQEGAVAYFGASRALDTLVNSESRIFATTPPHHGSYVD
ncbi:MAG TPA: hypothetical protein EYN66_02360, partial [Myxococcales bacterium]|nr:hypothetical protein [Myxococcales bacterium]